MARKIEWTRASIRDRFNIYQFWKEHNHSDSYSKELEKLFNEAARLISEFPQIGTETDFPGLRIKIVKSYKLFYLVQSDTIRIIRIWDYKARSTKFKVALTAGKEFGHIAKSTRGIRRSSVALSQ